MELFAGAPAPVPLVLTQHYESLAETRHNAADVVGEAAYTEIVGLIPTGQTRPVITGTREAIDALLLYDSANPTRPMTLPSRNELSAFADRQVNLAARANRKGLAAFYDIALLAYDAGENGVNDAWYFPGAQIATVGTATICGRVILYEATPDLVKQLVAWDTNGGQETLKNNDVRISPEDFRRMFRPAPPLPDMGTGGSGDFLSRSDQNGGAERSWRISRNWDTNRR